MRRGGGVIGPRLQHDAEVGAMEGRADFGSPAIVPLPPDRTMREWRFCDRSFLHTPSI